MTGVNSHTRAAPDFFSGGLLDERSSREKKKLAFGLLNRSPVWSFLRQKLLNPFDHSLPHRKSTSALPPATDIPVALADFRY